MIRFGPLLQLSPPEQAHSYCWGWFDLVFKSKTIVTWKTFIDTIFL